jgi:effector-binding domain-containing protein
MSFVNRAFVTLTRALALLLVVSAAYPAMAQTTGATPPAATAPQPGLSGPTEMVLQPRTVLGIRGEATWDDGFDKLFAAFASLREEAGKRGLAVSGRPQAIFLSTDDTGFRYEAVLTLAEGTPLAETLPGGFRISRSPEGRTLLFTHVGAYDEIDTSYEAITAYLDEKGITARNLFIEEYVNDPASSEDVSLQMNIYVLVN